MTIITSPANPRISTVRDLHTLKGRKKHGLFLMEGPHLLLALLDAHITPLEVYYQPEIMRRMREGSALLERLLHTPDVAQQRLIEVSERVVEALGEVQTSQGVVSVLPLEAFTAHQTRVRRATHQQAAHQRPTLLILDDIADPGNMGTILRTALAADVESVILTMHCVDHYNPKVVRAAAAAHIALPIEAGLSWNSISDRISTHCKGTPHVLLAEAGSSHLYYEQDLTQPFALIIGNEAHGPSADARARATRTITIPLANAVESLNAAMATGIILYEAVRQQKSQPLDRV